MDMDILSADTLTLLRNATFVDAIHKVMDTG